MADPELRIVHLDDSLAVVDKPAGLVVHPAPSHTGPTLVSELAEILGGGAEPERPGIVHRLDKGTSGLLVVARDDETHAALQEQVREREVERVYLALAGGRLGSRTGTIDAPIGRAARQRHRMAVSGAASREARTHFDGPRAAAAGDLPGGAAGDGAHAPDPRPLRRHRPPADGRYDLWRRRALRPRAAVSPRPPPLFPAPAQRRAPRLRLAAAGGPGAGAGGGPRRIGAPLYNRPCKSNPRPTDRTRSCLVTTRSRGKQGEAHRQQFKETKTCQRPAPQRPRRT